MIKLFQMLSQVSSELIECSSVNVKQLHIKEYYVYVQNYNPIILEIAGIAKKM